MSVTLDGGNYFRERQSSGMMENGLWPAYHMDSNLRLLGRTQQNNQSLTVEPKPVPCMNQYDKMNKYTRLGNIQQSGPRDLPYFENAIHEQEPTYMDIDGNNDTRKIDFVSEETANDRELATSRLSLGNKVIGFNEKNDNGDFHSEGKRENSPALKAFYSTSTQRLYEGADWPRRLIQSPAPPRTTKEKHADTVSFRYESKRYEAKSEQWQTFGSRPFSWDYTQSRNGHHIYGPVTFCSPNKKILHIPGYMGHVSGGPGEMDNPITNYVSKNKLRTAQPKYWDCARKGNIPGYTGCVFYAEHQPACVNDPEHLRSTVSTSYRQHKEIGCNVKSPFKKEAPLSRMVTLTHPFNPFNKVY